MANKKKKPRKRKPDKPLLAFTGILHLQKSFVPPSQESGLLNTVGGGSENQALVLAPNYGYGISAAFVSQLLDSKAEEEVAAASANSAVDINGTTNITTDKNVIELNEEFPVGDDTPKNSNPDGLSIAELVRSIGGAKDKPFMRSDVVEDPVLESLSSAHQNEDNEKENLPEENKFYESLGISRAALATKDDIAADDSVNIPDASTGKENELNYEPVAESNTDVTESIADYYKTYCHYYFSSTPEPYGDRPIEFGLNITPDANQDNRDQDESIIELARMAQRARRAMEAAKLAARHVYGPCNLMEDDGASYDPLPMEVILSGTSDKFVNSKDTTMDQYWEYVKENPRDFNRWTYLIQHAENSKNIVECRKAYSAFLPLFPYCFGYWKRYCDIEKGHLYYQRSLSILLRGLEFNPLSIDMWLSYLSLFSEVYRHHKNFHANMREQYERALNSAGLEFRSDALWENYIDWETNHQNLKNAFIIYRRLLGVPTRLYNRHWDNLKALIRDHHPRDFLEKSEYELLRKKGCKNLGFRYREEPEIEPGEIVKTSKPEDKLMDYVKLKILSKLEKTHKAVMTEADKRWDFEDQIKRPYFHIKPLDKGQLRNWENYLNFEMTQTNHDRTVLLFERCLIACAMYERFWCKYARYLEKYHRKECNANKKVSVHFQKSQISFDIGSKKEIIEEEALVTTVQLVLKNIINQIVEEDEVKQSAVRGVVNNLLDNVCDDRTDTLSDTVDTSENRECVKVSSNEVMDSVMSVSQMDTECLYHEGRATAGSVALSGHSVTELPPNSVEQIVNHTDTDVSTLASLLGVPTFPPGKIYWHDVIRDVYKRACIVHCPRKPILRLQWAAFEEEIGNVSGAKELIQHALDWFPDLLDAKAQMIELERRSGNSEQVVRLFENYLKTAANITEYSTLSIKYARFLYKEIGKPDKALAILRKAVKKDKGNHQLYSYVFDICHERFPSDRKGAAAALELALQNKEIKNEFKVQFAKKKVLFLQEHGELARYRDAVDQLYELQDSVAKDMAADAAAKRAAEGPSQFVGPMPMTMWDQQDYVPISFESVEDGEGGNAQPETGTGESPDKVYKSVPPTQELLENFSSYGYQISHPDSKLQDTLSHREYDRLISQGYAREQVEQEKNNSRGIKRKSNAVPTYIIPPKGTYLVDYLNKGRPKPKSNRK